MIFRILPKPKNQHALVLHTLIHPPRELSLSHWMNQYKSAKFSTRLGELERKLNIKLVDRIIKPFVCRFGTKHYYTVYKPILSKEQYLEFYNQVNK